MGRCCQRSTSDFAELIEIYGEPRKFANFSALVTSWPDAPDGAEAVTVDDYTRFYSRAGTWYPIGQSGRTGFAFGPDDMNGTGIIAFPYAFYREPIVTATIVGQNYADQIHVAFTGGSAVDGIGYFVWRDKKDSDAFAASLYWRASDATAPYPARGTAGWP